MQKLNNKVVSINTSLSHSRSLPHHDQSYGHLTYNGHSTHRNSNTYKRDAYKRYDASQNGMSVTEIVFFLLALGVFIKLAIAIMPAQVGDYQFTKLVAQQLRVANDNKHSATDFMKNLNKQLIINSSYDAKPEEMIKFTNNNTGRLAVEKDYQVVNNFFGNVDIVNKFEGEITPADAND